MSDTTIITSRSRYHRFVAYDLLMSALFTGSLVTMLAALL